MAVRRWTIAGWLAVLLLLARPADGTPATAGDGVRFGPDRAIERVVVIGFDNTPLADIQAMPRLWSLISGGAVLANSHSVVPSLTHVNYATLATGLYPSGHGVTGQTFRFGGALTRFGYWESTDQDRLPYNLAPPPWRALNARGASVGAVGWPDMGLQTAAEVEARAVPLQPGSPLRDDYLGVSLHRPDGTVAFGTPNLPALFQMPRWDEPREALGAFPATPVWATELAWWPLAATYALLAMDTHVTFTYITRVHEGRAPEGYADRLAANDAAFARFFDSLAAIKITPANTIFVFTTDEGDYFSASGERVTNLANQLAAATDGTVQPEMLAIASSSAPLVYITDAQRREATRTAILAALPQVPGWDHAASGPVLCALHLCVERDRARTPDLLLLGAPAWVYATRVPGTSVEAVSGPSWTHGGVHPEMLRAWSAFVGPGVRSGAVIDAWTDNVDVMPTLQTLLALPRQPTDGHVVVEVIADALLPADVRQQRDLLGRVAEAYKQLYAPAGSVNQALLAEAAVAIRAANPAQIGAFEQQLTERLRHRDALALRLRAWLTDALSGIPIDAAAADTLLHEAALPR